MTTQDFRNESDLTENNSRKRKESPWIWGLILIGIGIINLSGNLIPWDNFGRVVMPLLAAAFFLAGLVSRDAGWFIPAGILGGIGAGVFLISGPFSDISGEQTAGILMLSMGLGWASIPLTSRIFARCTVLWPFIPAAIMSFIGAALLIGGLALNLLLLAGNLWPFILIGLGILMLLRQWTGSQNTDR